MYLQYYSLVRKPFDKSPDPESLWLGERHMQALTRFQQGILENSGIFVITGDVGTGKTVLVERLLKLVEDAAIVVTVPDPDMGRLDFLNYLADGLGMRERFDSKGEFLIHFKRLLHTARSDNRTILLVVDEAQRLDHEMLQEIRLLANIHIGSRTPLNILLVGQPGLIDLLQDACAENVRQRITASYHVDSLSADEVGGYIRHRLEAAGADAEIFTPEAIGEISRHTGGCPRLIDILCDHALLSGYVVGKKTVGREIISECIEELSVTFAGQFPALPQEEKAAAPGDAPLEEQVSMPVPESESLPSRDGLSLKKISFMLAAALLLAGAGYALRSPIFHPAPAATENEMAVQTFARLLNEQPENAGEKAFPGSPFGHEMGEDAETAQAPDLLEPAELEQRIVRRKIEIPAAHRIEIAETRQR